jgi:hypothetical protein
MAMFTSEFDWRGTNEPPIDGFEHEDVFDLRSGQLAKLVCQE